jgi:methionyl-tRNA synthetase
MTLISTAIPFVNARPHLGFAYELVLADVLARHRRLRGGAVRFVTGSDDHSLKNVVAAEREGLPTRTLVERNSEAFRAVSAALDVAPDDFIATSRDPRHRPAVEALWRACAADLYRAEWQGLYCAGCEAFVDGDARCPEHGTLPEPVREPNWFFRVSRYRDAIRDAITSGRLAIVPDAARAETLAFLAGEVRDLSVSRAATRARGWGLAVPGDPDQVIYVWFDALAYYLTALGYGGPSWREAAWRDAAPCHVIGKGITRFHAVYWAAFLLAAGLPLPAQIFVHGYLTIDGEKISKSGRSLEVAPLAAELGADALRWYFVRRCRTRSDADVSIAGIRAAHDLDLADGLGNLVQRTTALAARLAAGPTSAVDSHLQALCDALPGRVDAGLAAFAPDEAVGAITELVAAANAALERSQPWRLARSAPAEAAAALAGPLEAARVAARELAPFVPATSRAILARLGPGAPLPPGPPPIPRLTAAR